VWTFYRWKKYGDMVLADTRRLKALKKENTDLKKMLAELILENCMRKEVDSKNGGHCTKENGRRSCHCSVTVLGAQDLSLLGNKSC